MNEMETIRAKCPQCGRALAPLPFMRSATEVVRRTCHKCHSQWQMVVKPVKRTADVNVTVVDFLAL
jgi:transcription elongation factor Elf1